MSAQLSKRQQARNERVLQDLIKTVPGNNVCADCQARNPGWASWSLGIFLCMQCAAVHRKLGTHITKVKSLTMDSWSHEQVETMKRIGNIASNRIYNPQNTKAPINYDANEVDAAMERFIRQKYQGKVIEVSKISNLAKCDLGNDDQPPPLPPKVGSRFGLRSKSSLLHLSSHHKREGKQQQQQQNENDRPPDLRRNQPSRVFGITIDVAESYESKNLKLCEMGFTDQSINMAVLKQLGGDLEKSIEALISLKEKNIRGLKQTEKLSENRSISSSDLSDSLGNPSNILSNNSSNPFTLFDSVTPISPPQSSQSTGVLQNQAMNGFGQQQLASNLEGLMPPQPSFTLSQKFQHMSLNKSQSLFPNHTGPGFPGVQLSQVELQQKSLTPPVPHMYHQYHQYHTPTAFQDSAQPMAQNLNYNPFNQAINQELFTGKTNNSDFIDNRHLENYNSYLNQTQIASAHQAPLLDYSVQQPHLGNNPYQNRVNPFYNSSTSLTNTMQPHGLQQKFNNAPLSNQFQVPQPKVGPVIPKLGCKFDSQSILDLYNYPNLAPDRPVLEKKVIQNQSTCLSEKKDTHVSLINTTAISKNPFSCDLTFATPIGKEENTATQIISRNLSQESLSLDNGWMNGRHSPDAWKSISTRSMR